MIINSRRKQHKFLGQGLFIYFFWHFGSNLFKIYHGKINLRGNALLKEMTKTLPIDYREQRTHELCLLC